MNISVFYTCKKIVSLYHDFYPDFDMEEFNYLNEVFKFPLEKRILLTASVLYEKREIEKDKFYFKFASYGFAFLVTGMFVVLMFVSMNMMKLYIFIPLVLLGSISIFMLVGNCCIPEISALIRRYNKKNKEL